MQRVDRRCRSNRRRRGYRPSPASARRASAAGVQTLRNRQSSSTAPRPCAPGCGQDGPKSARRTDAVARRVAARGAWKRAARAVADAAEDADSPSSIVRALGPAVAGARSAAARGARGRQRRPSQRAGAAPSRPCRSPRQPAAVDREDMAVHIIRGRTRRGTPPRRRDPQGAPQRPAGMRSRIGGCGSRRPAARRCCWSRYSRARSR